MLMPELYGRAVYAEVRGVDSLHSTASAQTLARMQPRLTRHPSPVGPHPGSPRSVSVSRGSGATQSPALGPACSSAVAPPVTRRSASRLPALRLRLPRLRRHSESCSPSGLLVRCRSESTLCLSHLPAPDQHRTQHPRGSWANSLERPAYTQTLPQTVVQTGHSMLRCASISVPHDGTHLSTRLRSQSAEIKAPFLSASHLFPTMARPHTTPSPRESGTR